MSLRGTVREMNELAVVCFDSGDGCAVCAEDEKRDKKEARQRGCLR